MLNQKNIIFLERLCLFFFNNILDNFIIENMNFMQYMILEGFPFRCGIKTTFTSFSNWSPRSLINLSQLYVASRVSQPLNYIYERIHFIWRSKIHSMFQTSYVLSFPYNLWNFIFFSLAYQPHYLVKLLFKVISTCCKLVNEKNHIDILFEREYVHLYVHIVWFWDKTYNYLIFNFLRRLTRYDLLVIHFLTYFKTLIINFITVEFFDNILYITKDTLRKTWWCPPNFLW